MVNFFFSRRALWLGIAILLAVSLLIGLAVSLHSTTYFFPMGHHPRNHGQPIRLRISRPPSVVRPLLRRRSPPTEAEDPRQ